MRQTLLSLIILLTVIAAAAQRTTQDITYGPHDRNNLIISSPDNAESNPVVVWFRQQHPPVTIVNTSDLAPMGGGYFVSEL